MEDDRVIVFRARATVVCAGAGAYKAPGYPTHGQTFDGDAMAYRVGASITGKEFVDFHWTSDRNPAEIWKMWSEEYLQKIWATPGPTGRQIPFYQPVFQVHTKGPPPAPLGGLPPSENGQGDPRGAALMPLPPEGNLVSGAATGLGIHKSEGIWPVDNKCFSGIPGLYAAGDALGSMLCGTVYPNIGTSFSGSAVQGYRAGGYAAEYAAEADQPSVPADEIRRVRERALAPLKRQNGFDPKWVSEVLLSTMAPYYVLFVKERGRLEGALANITFIRQYLTPRLRARDTHELRLAHEAENMALNAEMKLRASLMRTESRGSHYRADYPARNDREWLAWITIKQDSSGNMQLSKAPMPEAWKIDRELPYETKYPSRFPGELDCLKGKK
jgi:succinate dehydrogenase/fumarate reductase flavoprotein subunit